MALAKKLKRTYLILTKVNSFIFYNPRPKGRGNYITRNRID